MHRLQGKKLELEYPCSWQYKAIGKDRGLLEASLCEIFADCPCEIRYSNSSSTGKYHSFAINLTVHDEESRLSYYEQLQASAHILMVL